MPIVPAWADPSTVDMGGYIYDAGKEQLCAHMNITCAQYYNRHHLKFIGDGTYVSAATAALGIRRMCVTPTSRWGFHAVTRGEGINEVINPRSSALMRSFSPPRLRAYLDAQGAYQKRELTFVSGAKLIELGVRACPPNETN